MKTTPTEREAWRAEATLRYSDGMAVRVLDDLAACEARCAALQAENDAHATWLNEEWPTTEDMVLVAKVEALTKERDENEEIAKRALTMGLDYANWSRLVCEAATYALRQNSCQTKPGD